MRMLFLGAGLATAIVATTGAAHAVVRHHVVHGHSTFRTGSASSGAQCGPAASESDAFDVAGLKSELMVTALSCNEQEKYNAFVAKFHPNLVTEEEALNKYFNRAFGRGALKAHDDYITQLANVQADKGLSAGVAFCEQRAAMFDEVSSLDSTTDLVEYAHGKDIEQPADFVTCSAPSAGGSHVARVTRISAHRTLRRRH